MNVAHGFYLFQSKSFFYCLYAVLIDFPSSLHFWQHPKREKPKRNRCDFDSITAANTWSLSSVCFVYTFDLKIKVFLCWFCYNPAILGNSREVKSHTTDWLLWPWMTKLITQFVFLLQSFADFHRNVEIRFANNKLIRFNVLLSVEDVEHLTHWHVNSRKYKKCLSQQESWNCLFLCCR